MRNTYICLAQGRKIGSCSSVADRVVLGAKVRGQRQLYEELSDFLKYVDRIIRTKTKDDDVDANDNAVPVISSVLCHLCHKARMNGSRIQRYGEELANACEESVSVCMVCRMADIQGASAWRRTSQHHYCANCQID